MEEEIQEDKTPEEQEKPQEKGGFDALNITGCLLLPLAIFIDVFEIIIDFGGKLIGAVPVIGPFITVSGEILSIILDFIALLIFGIWILVKSGPKKALENKAIQKTTQRIDAGPVGRVLRKLSKSKILKGTLIGGEMIPVVPLLSSLPFWTFTIILELINKDD